MVTRCQLKKTVYNFHEKENKNFMMMFKVYDITLIAFAF